MTTTAERQEARRNALLRVATTHRTVAEIFAEMRGGERGASEPKADRAELHDAAQAPPSDLAEESGLEGVLRQTLAAIIDSATRARESSEVMRADPQDIALWFAVDAESILVDLAVAGASRLAHERGLDAVPAVADAGVDAASPCLAELADAIADAAERASRSGVVSGFARVDEEMLAPAATRLAVAAGNAGYAAAARSVRLSPRQHFGDPYCPAAACYGQDTRLLDESTVTTMGLPPYADDCNCTVGID